MNWKQAVVLVILVGIVSSIVWYSLWTQLDSSMRNIASKNQVIDNLVKESNEKSNLENIENKTVEVTNDKKIDNTNPIKILTNEDGYHWNWILKEFENTTWIKTLTSFTEDSMLTRLANREEWDIIFNKISSELVEAKNKDLLWTINNKLVLNNVAVENKDSDNKWFNLTYRVRSFYVKKWVTEFPKTYEELSDPKYKWKICIRPLSHTYNIQLIWYMIAKHGEEYTKKWLYWLNDNLALPASWNDRDQVKNIFNGKCDISVWNSYYMWLMLSTDEQRDWANSVNLYFPNQETDWALALYNGIWLTKSGEKNWNIDKLINFLLSPLWQQYLASTNFEFPADKSVKIESEMIKSFWKFQNIDVNQIKLDNAITQENIANQRENALLLVKELPIK